MSICEQDQYNSTYGLFDLTIYKNVDSWAISKYFEREIGSPFPPSDREPGGQTVARLLLKAKRN